MWVHVALFIAVTPLTAGFLPSLRVCHPAPPFQPPHGGSRAIMATMIASPISSAPSIPDDEPPSSEPPPRSAGRAALVGMSKDDLFAALQSPSSRRAAFETLWNSEFDFDTVDYQQLMLACCRLGYLRPFQDLIDEIVRFGVRVGHDTWGACIVLATKREFFRLGIACVEKMIEAGEKPNGKALNQVMALCAKKGRWEEALELFQLMTRSGIEPPPLTYWALATLLSSKGQWKEFREVEDDLQQRPFPDGIKERFYSTAVIARSGARDWQGALDVLKRMHKSGTVPSLKSFTTALTTCMAAGRFSAVRDAVAEAQAWGITDFDVATYNVVINSYASEHDLDGARQWFNRIYEAGLKPSLISYSTIFKVCASTRRADVARQLFDQMLEKDQLEPNLITISHAVQALASNKSHLEEACDLLASTESRFGFKPNGTAYSFVLRAAGDTGQVGLAKELYHRMKEVDGLTPEPRCIWEMAVMANKCREYSIVRELVEDLTTLSKDTHNIRSLLWSYNAVLAAIEKSGDGPLALQVWQQMQSQGLVGDAATVCRLLETFNKARMPRRTLEVYEEFSRRVPELRTSVNVTNAVLQAMAITNPLKAVEMFQEMKEAKLVDERSYGHAFTAYDTLGDAEGVKRLWDEMRESRMKIDRVTYGSLLRALATCGDVDAAMDGLRMSEQVGITMNNYTIALALIGCKRSRKWNTALGMMRELRDDNGLPLNVVVYNSVMTVCNAAGQWRACLQLLKEMREHHVDPDYTSLRVALNALASAGRNYDLVKLYKEHRDGLLSHLDTFAFRLVINAMISTDPTGAYELIKAQESKRSGFVVDTKIYKALLTAFGTRKLWESAMKVLQALPEPHRRDVSLISATVSALIRSDQYELARDLLATAEADGVAFDSVALSLGMQVGYLAEDFDTANRYLDRLREINGHGNSTTNFGISLLARQGKWTDMEEVLDVVQEMAAKGRRFAVSKLTLETVAEAFVTPEQEPLKVKLLQVLATMVDEAREGASRSDKQRSRRGRLSELGIREQGDLVREEASTGLEVREPEDVGLHVEAHLSEGSELPEVSERTEQQDQ